MVSATAWRPSKQIPAIYAQHVNGLSLDEVTRRSPSCGSCRRCIAALTSSATPKPRRQKRRTRFRTTLGHKSPFAHWRSTFVHTTPWIDIASSTGSPSAKTPDASRDRFVRSAVAESRRRRARKVRARRRVCVYASSVKSRESDWTCWSKAKSRRPSIQEATAPTGPWSAISAFSRSISTRAVSRNIAVTNFSLESKCR